MQELELNVFGHKDGEMDDENQLSLFDYHEDIAKQMFYGLTAQLDKHYRFSEILKDTEVMELLKEYFLKQEFNKLIDE